MADNAELVDRMRKNGKASFQDILVFNELSALTRKANADPQAPLSAGLEGLMAVYDCAAAAAVKSFTVNFQLLQVGWRLGGE